MSAEPNDVRLPIRVGLGDLPPVIADGIRGWLRRDWRTAPVAAGADWDVVVLDPLGGERVPIAYGRPVVAFSPPQERHVIAAILAAGACAFVPQSGHRQALIDAIVAVARASPRGGRPVPRLSDRERTALLWWLRSMTKASVARRMSVSPHTVDMYIKRIRAKYADVGVSVPTKADLLARVLADGLVDAEDLVTG